MALPARSRTKDCADPSFPLSLAAWEGESVSALGIALIFRSPWGISTEESPIGRTRVTTLFVPQGAVLRFRGRLLCLELSPAHGGCVAP